MKCTRCDRFGFALVVGFCALASGFSSACATNPDEPQEPTYRIVRPAEPTMTQSGIPVDKQADIQLIFQQRDPTARKCYQDVLNEKHDRAFAGRVALVIHFETTGRASEVKVAQSTLNSPEVESCLIEKIKGFEFPALEQPGDMQFEYTFRPAY